MAFMGGDIVLDHFWYGAPWSIGLKRFTDDLKKHEEMTFYFRPLKKNAPFIKMGGVPDSAFPDFTKQSSILSINKVELLPEYRMSVEL